MGGEKQETLENKQKDEESVEQMEGMCTGHETAGGNGGEGTVQIKRVVAIAEGVKDTLVWWWKMDELRNKILNLVATFFKSLLFLLCMQQRVIYKLPFPSNLLSWT